MGLRSPKPSSPSSNLRAPSCPPSLFGEGELWQDWGEVTGSLFPHSPSSRAWMLFCRSRRGWQSNDTPCPSLLPAGHTDFFSFLPPPGAPSHLPPPE